MAGKARNLAKNGATVADVAAQASEVARSPAEYVTILIGANDACRSPMTEVNTFREQLDVALTRIKDAAPEARLLLVSLPNIHRVWEIGHTNRIALAAWKSTVCPSLLANPQSTEPADVARRNAFKERVFAYNDQIADACADYGARCRFSDVSDFAFQLNNLSAIDFFHPNASGQYALVEQTFPDAFDW